MTITIYPNIPFLQEDLIDSGQGIYPDKARVFVTGENPAVNNAPLTIWPGPTAKYVNPASAIQMSVVSTSASDTVAGAGAQKVTIEYLDQNYVEQTETVSLNGTTPVNTVATNILRVNYMYVSQVTSFDISAVGTISLTSVGGATTYSLILPNNNSSRQAIYTVPAGKHLHINHVQVSEGTASGAHFTKFLLVSNSRNGVLTGNALTVKDNFALQNQALEISYETPFSIPPTGYVEMLAVSDSVSAGALCTAAFSGWLDRTL